MISLDEYMRPFKDLGALIIKLHSIREGICSCGDDKCFISAGKHPIHGVYSGRVNTKLIEGNNYGIQCGGNVGIYCVDVDTRNDGHLSIDALEKVYGKLPTSATVISGSHSGSYHKYYRGPVNLCSTKLGAGIDFQGTGLLTVAPGSMHRSGHLYEWDENNHPDDVGFAQLPQWILDLLETKKLLITNDTVEKISDGNFKHVVEKLKELDPSCGRKEWVEIGMAMHSTGHGDTAFFEWNNWSKGSAKYVGVNDLEIRWKSFKYVEGGKTWRSITSDWDKPEPEINVIIGIDQLLSKKEEVVDTAVPLNPTVKIPHATTDNCPESILSWATNASKRIGCNIDGPLMCAINACAACLDSDFSILCNGKWIEYATLWTCIAAQPSRIKSNIIKEASLRLFKEDAILAEKTKQESKDYKKRFAMYKADFETWQKEAKTKKMTLMPKLPPDEPEYPKKYSAVIQDITIESAAILAQDNEARGLLLYKDELRGLFDKCGKLKDNGEQEKVFWLQSYNNDSYSVNRVGRDFLRINKLRVNIVGGVQINYLKEFLEKADIDGFISRFQFVKHELTLESDPTVIDDSLFDIQDRLMKLKGKQHTFSPEAQALFDVTCYQYRKELLSTESEAWAAYIGKRSGLLGRLCLIFNAIMGRSEIVDFDVVNRSTKFIAEFLIPHQYALYLESNIDLDNDIIMLTSIEKSIISLCKKKNLYENITNRILTMGCKPYRVASNVDRQRAIENLISFGLFYNTSSIQKFCLTTNKTILDSN